MVELPWSKQSEDRLDPEEARRILDEDHYGLDKVKDRIVEYIAVLSLKRDLKGPILCFVGPPGTGKTSLGRSIARIDEPQVRADRPRRRARRGGDPRAPAHLHRLDARQDHPVDEEGEVVEPAVPARRDRQDGRRFPRRPSSALLRSDPEQNSRMDTISKSNMICRA
jgi:ATP-dependent Lon protease